MIERATLGTLVALSALLTQLGVVALAPPARPSPVQGVPGSEFVSASSAEEDEPIAGSASSPAGTRRTSIERHPSGTSGTLGVRPNPLVVCTKTGLGVATLTWTSTGTSFTEIRVGTPDGTLVTNGGAEGTVTLPAWVGQGSVFLLQDASPGTPRDASHTLARLEVDKVVPGPCEGP